MSPPQLKPAVRIVGYYGLDFIDPAARTLVLSIVGTRPGAITAYIAEGRVIEIDATSCRIDYRALVTTTAGREDQIREGLMKTWEIMFAGLESAAVQLTRNDN